MGKTPQIPVQINIQQPSANILYCQSLDGQKPVLPVNNQESRSIETYNRQIKTGGAPIWIW
jgi:hypothetical protein